MEELGPRPPVNGNLRNLLGGKSGTTRLLLRFFVGLVILTALLMVVEPREIAEAFRNADSTHILMAIVLLLPNLGLQYLKWRRIVQMVKPEVTRREVLLSLMYGLAVGSLTPGKVGEVGGRLFGIESVRRSQILALALIDKLQIMCVITVGGLIGSSFIFVEAQGLALAGSMLITGMLILVALHPKSLRVFVRPLERIRFVGKWLGEFRESLRYFDKKTLIITLLQSVLIYGTVFLQMHLLLSAFSVVPVISSLLGYSTMMFYKSLLPLSIGDLGIREATSVYFFSQVGVAGAVAFNASLLLAVINIFLPAFVGTLYTMSPTRTPDSEEITNTD